jgi:hypothetical protein
VDGCEILHQLVTVGNLTTLLNIAIEHGDL